jgi:hypothetical protein
VAFLQKPPTAADRKPVTTVRADAVAQRPRGTVVYVQAGEKARETAVTTGRKLGDLVEVSGLKPGDKVVLKPSEKVIDGARVAVVKK